MPRVRRQTLIALHVLWLLAGSPAGATTYYVTPAGSDAAPGSTAQPWATLQKAGDVADAGDTVVVRAGTYAGFRPRHSGTAAAPIRFRADAGVVVASPGPSNSNGDDIWVRDVHYVVIDGFETTAAPRAGVAVQGEPEDNATGVEIRNCYCHHNQRWGIFTGFARDLVIEGNETSYSALEHGIYVSNSGDRPIVRANRVHDNRASGIQLNADPAQQGPDPNDPQGDGIIEDALIEDNVIHDNGAGGAAGINLASVRSSLIRNNLLYENHASGIAGWDDGEGSGRYGTRDNRFVGNTIVQASDGRFAVSLKNGSVNNLLADNILLHPGSKGSIEADPSSQVGLASDHNVVVDLFSDDDSFLHLADWRALGFDAHSLVSTPAIVFADPSAMDYRLRTGSPASMPASSRPTYPSTSKAVSDRRGPASTAAPTSDRRQRRPPPHRQPRRAHRRPRPSRPPPSLTPTSPAAGLVISGAVRFHASGGARWRA